MPKRRPTDLSAPEYVQARELVHRLTKLRHRHRITQAELNRVVKYSQSGISMWESFHFPNYSLVTLIRIARGIGYRVKVSFEREVDK